MKIGIYSEGKLLIDYPTTFQGIMEAAKDLKSAVEETGELHELKVIKEVNYGYVLKDKVKAEEEFFNCKALLGSTVTKEILEEIKLAVMCGVDPKQVKDVIQTLKMAKDLERQFNEI